MPDISKLDYKSDLEDALLTESADGPVDGGSRTWTGVNDADGSDLGAAIEIESADGNAKRAIVRLPVDVNMFSFTVVEEGGVDDAATPEVEKLRKVYHLAGEHSKATDLGGAAGSITKGSGFPPMVKRP